MTDAHTTHTAHTTLTDLSRPGGALGGDSARVERPDSLAAAAELLRQSHGTVLLCGGGTKLDWGGLVTDPDLVVHTRDLRGVLTHNPADMTASVRAGTTLTDLQEHLDGDNQWLALDPPTATRGATVGGLLAAGDSGPSRLRYGGLRDLVIGVTLVLADGTVARSGGHVIKNVAGYDLAKLVHGSLGSLALVAEVVVRLHPRPAASLTVAGPADAAQATAAALALAASPLEPAAVEWVGGAESGTLYVREDGSASHVETAGTRTVQLLQTLGVVAQTLSSDEGRAAWHDHATAVIGSNDETVLRVSSRPSDLAHLVRHAAEAARASGVTLQVVSSAGLGLHTFRLRGGEAADHARAMTVVREYALSRHASVLLRQRPDEVNRLVDALGPPPSTAALLGQIKAQFDPAGRLAPARFAPWY